MVQEIESSVVLLSEVNVGHRNKYLDDIAEIFSNGIVQRCVAIGILREGDEVGVK